jgi:hypothetical protein
MSSRQEEKERRRREREEAEAAAAKSGAARKRLGLVLGAVLAAAVALIVVLAVATGDDEGADRSPSDANIPAFRVTNAAEAARAASCELAEHEIEGRDHTGEAVRYETNPPTSGDHDPVPAEDGIYAPGNPPDLEQSVHSLEHGRINIQYKPGTPAETVNRLEALMNFEVKGEEGYHALLFENQTGMEAQVAATAWGRSLTCPRMNEQVFDAIRAFWRTNVDKGPEFIP